MASPLTWESQASASDQVAGRRLLVGIARRSFAWGLMTLGGALAVLRAIAPAVEIPLTNLIPAVVVLPGVFLLPLLILRARPVRFRLDDVGLQVNGRMTCRWRRAIGFSYQTDPEPTLIAVDRRGVPFRISLPDEPLGAEIVAWARQLMTPLSPAALAPYLVQVTFSWVEVGVLTGLAFANGVLVRSIAPLLIKRLPVPVFFAVLVGLSLPAAVAAAWRTRRRFGQFRPLFLYAFAVAWWFTFELTAIFSVAFTAKAVGWLDLPT